MREQPHNKVCQVEDFSSDDLAGIVRDAFDPDGRRYGVAFPRAGACA